MSGKKQKKLRKKVKAIMKINGIDDSTFKRRMKMAKKALRVGLITNLLLISTNLVFADKLKIPYSCYPKEIQANFLDIGRKLDLSGNDRTRDSWGFLVNEGSEFTIYTYKGATEEDLKAVMDIIQGE